MNHTNSLKLIFSKIKNSPNKLRREIERIPALRAKQEKAYQERLKNHASFLPKLNPEDTKILESLRRDGIYIAPIEKLGLPLSTSMLSSALGLAKQSKQISPRKDTRFIYQSSSVSLVKTYLVNFPEIFLWALETKLLDIIENYIGLPIKYQGPAIRRDFTDGEKVDVRRWHLDWEDRRTIKIIIYLNDVNIDGGPFEYIEKNTALRAAKILNYHNLGYVSDEEMLSVVPKYQWKTCLGETGTLIVADTSSVFHRAKPPVKHERFSLSYCYTSDRPKVMWKCHNVSQQQWQSIERQLDRRQMDCLSRK